MIWSSAPDGTPFNGAGIWMAGRAPVIDASNNVYYTTGNGTWDGTTNFGESFVKFGPTPTRRCSTGSRPTSCRSSTTRTLDLGGSGPILVPGTDLIVSGGKGGVFYMTHTGDLGHRSTNDVQHRAVVRQQQSGRIERSDQGRPDLLEPRRRRRSLDVCLVGRLQLLQRLPFQRHRRSTRRRLRRARSSRRAVRRAAC